MKHVRTVSIVSVLALVSFAFCGEIPAAKIKSLDPAQVKVLMEKNDTNLLVLDVRTPGEYEAAHIPGVRLIPVQVLADSLAGLAPYKNRPVITTCRSGHRSLKAAEILIGAGFTDVTNMTEGINGWIGRGIPVLKGAP